MVFRTTEAVIGGAESENLLGPGPATCTGRPIPHSAPPNCSEVVLNRAEAQPVPNVTVIDRRWNMEAFTIFHA